MNKQAFIDGRKVDKMRGGDIDKLERAIADCEVLGWEYLKAYFLGQLEGTRMTQDKNNMVKCDGWASDLGCDKTCAPSDWEGKYGGRNLCDKCRQRLEEDERHWRWVTR